MTSLYSFTNKCATIACHCLYYKESSIDNNYLADLL